MRLRVFLLFFLFVVGFSIVSAQDSCYINLKINESLINNQTQFSLAGLENLYGNYAGFVEGYSSETGSDYKLNVYSSYGLLGQYALYSSRFTLWDNFNDSENPGGVIEMGSGVIDTIVPYLENISSEKIENNGTETDLTVDVSKIKCERTCKIEGEFGVYDKDMCCSEFSPIQKSNGQFVCANIGDGVCSSSEDYFSSSDCSIDESDSSSLADILTRWKQGLFGLEGTMRRIVGFFG